MANLDCRHGAEGPAFDPYSYTEWRFKNNGRVVIGHFGLAKWVKVDGKIVTEQDDEVCAAFEHFTGISVLQARRVYERIHNGRCRACGTNKYVEEVPGYPGETFYICQKCGEVVDSEFNESAII